MDCSDLTAVEVEGDSLFTLEKTSDTLWTYLLNTEKYYGLFNITMLFRGNDEDILSEILYVIMTVNGYCVDTLKSTNEDIRVKEFLSFDENNIFPSYANSTTKIIVAFKKPHEFQEDKIRIISDAILYTDDLHKHNYYEFQTRIASLEIVNNEIVVKQGELWTLDLIKDILDNETDLVIEKNLITECTDSDIDSIDYEMKYNDLISDEISFYMHLDSVIRWRSQQKLIREKLTQLNTRSILHSSQDSNTSPKMP
jgi:hypothetical protein